MGMAQPRSGDTGSFQVTARDRINVGLPDQDDSSETSAWMGGWLTFFAYFVPPLGFFVPFQSPNARMSVVAVLMLCSALYAWFVLDSNSGHRIRLLMYGFIGAGTFFFFAAKQVFGL
jgi:hypothetical protein